MLSQPQIYRVWEEGISCDMRACYFGELVLKYNKRQQWTTTAQLILSGGAAGALALKIDSIILPAVLSFLAAICGLYSLIAQNHKRAIEASGIQAQWIETGRRYRYVWEHTWAEDAEARLESADDLGAKASGGSALFSMDQNRLRHLFDHAEALWLARNGIQAT